ncbi:hypothetical protein B0H14DRAFT_3445854 [Mycena olivaceomarginata]|nr:hypothetical protein B0H14DRAFT_3445854 [Mycena olivaceomarginata]
MVRPIDVKERRVTPSHARTYLLCLLSVAAAANVQRDSNAAAADNNISGAQHPQHGRHLGLAVAGVTTLICFIEFFVWSSTANANSGARNDHALPVNAERGFIDGDDAMPCASSTYAASTADFQHAR